MAVETRHARCLGQQHLRLGQDDLAGTFQVAEQAFAVAHREALGFGKQCASLLQSLIFATLLVRGAQFQIQLGALAAEFLSRFQRFLFEAQFAAIEVVEAAGNFARHLDVRHLVFAHRNEAGAVDQDVSGLQQRVAEEAVGGEILLLELLDLVLVRRHAFEPTQRCAHRKQQEQLGVLGHTALDEQRGLRRIDAGSEPVDQHFPHGLRDHLG